MVVNISSTILTTAQNVLLQKGLSFCPTAKPDWFNIEMDLIQFARRLKLAVWFDDKMQNTIDSTVPSDLNLVEFRLKDVDLFIKSDFLPPAVFHPVESFVNLVKMDLEKLKTDSQSNFLVHPNMTHEEIQALNELSNNHTITIKQGTREGA